LNLSDVKALSPHANDFAVVRLLATLEGEA
jgi:hypothetical protein